MLLSSCFEQPQRYFAIYTVELHEGGWVPEIFPHDIVEIYETHDIDTNQVWVKFELGAESMDLKSFQKLNSIEVTQAFFRQPSNITWWFESIVEQSSANDNALYAHIYKGSCNEGGIAYLAISKINNLAYWWCQVE